jgi:hypothetical protein
MALDHRLGVEDGGRHSAEVGEGPAVAIEEADLALENDEGA